MAGRPPSIAVAPADLAAWAELFDAATLPVLDGTAEAIDELKVDEDAADAHLLAERLAPDPLATLKLLAHVSALRRERRMHSRGQLEGDAETITEALVMLGIPPFFRAFGTCATVSGWLHGEPEAQAGFGRVLERSRRAAQFALGFAAHRADPDGALIGEAALLHDFAELLLWLRAPLLAGEVARRQAADSALRSADVQREVFGIELPALQHELMLRWGLPRSLVHATDETGDPSLRREFRDPHALRCVQLAVRLARHSAAGWANPALPDDVREVAALLNLGIEPTSRLLRDIDGG